MRNIITAALAALARPSATVPVSTPTVVPAPERVRVPNPVSGNGLLLATYNLRVVHFRRTDGRDFTIAYSPRRSRNHTLNIAIANRNPGDTFSRKEGTSQAVLAYTVNEVVKLPPLGLLSDVELLQLYFQGGTFDQSAEIALATQLRD